MKHEVFVPVSAERLRVALADPAQVARAVPGLQQDAGSEPVAGRLKLRVGGHAITYRGAVRVTDREDGSYVVEGEATEVRGHGTVKFTLTLTLTETDGASTLTFTASASSTGRITEQPREAVTSALTRLLDRFAENLGAAEAQAGEGEDAEDAVPAAGEPEVAPDADDTPLRQDSEDSEDSEDADGPPAEAAHARRTMIGRSAEEVDHAPPRGRYAPVPAPQTIVPNPALRWAVPAAALAVASAIALTRALRKKRG
ncbi:SRPBCC family protein [Streptomyces griseus]|uniref:SRPBCC family protein n=1 Tax=Streptomyces griseus TaxID=1911 RepID=UPI000564F79B|nr:SRPBCC domain-containing protein [Streptomyces griseus]